MESACFFDIVLIMAQTFGLLYGNAFRLKSFLRNAKEWKQGERAVRFFEKWRLIFMVFFPQDRYPALILYLQNLVSTTILSAIFFRALKYLDRN